MSNKKNRSLYMIGNAHLDPVWLWRWQEGYSEVFATFRSALDRMNENPDFIFTCSSAAYYKWVREADPEMFEEIRQRVAEGRWQIVGGWWIQPDCNMPSGESFARHALYSQRFYLENFGRACTVGYCVDSFGHAGTLPQLLQGGGMDAYVCLRPGRYENDIMPEDTFLWEGIDGSRVMGYRIYHSYGNHGPHGEENANMLSKINVAAQRAAEKDEDLMLFYGVGNHGGGPTKRNLKAIDAYNADPANDTRLIYSTPRHFFDHMSQSDAKLRLFKGEMQHHASGCYSVMSEIKRNNRLAENRLLRAEKFSALTSVLQNTPYPDFGSAWEGVMFNHFHDILCGCCIQPAYDDARELHGESLSFGAKTLNFAVQRISKNINTMLPGVTLDGKEDWCLWKERDLPVPVVIFNAQSYPVTQTVRLNAQLFRITDASGKTVPIQLVQSKKGNGKDVFDTVFNAELPAFGYTTYWAYKGDGEFTSLPTQLRATKTTLENSFLKLTVNPKTGAATLFDKQSGRKVFSQGAVPVIVNDFDHDTWAHHKYTFRDDLGTMQCVSVKLIEKGDVCATIRVEYEWNRSRLRQDFTLTPDTKEVEVRCKTCWHDDLTILKLDFPVNARRVTSFGEAPYGVALRRPTGEEEVCQTFFGAVGTASDGSTCGLGIANDSKYSYDCLKNDLRFTVIRNAQFADHFTDDREKYEWEHTDEGVQYFTYRLVPLSGAQPQSSLVQSAHALNNPPEVIWESYHKGSGLPLSATYLKVSRPNVEVTVFKRSEENDGWILRAYETAGKAVKAEFDLRMLGRRLTADFAPHQIRTFKLTDTDVIDVNFIEL
ncbi:MAG: alpha-mannosidase [Clostridia bacterium]|nr:alpha-mannosidase [Clostridia bacterium]